MTKYLDFDGKPTTLYKLVRDEPDWAASKIDFMNKRITELEATIERLRDEVRERGKFIDELEEALGDKI